MRIAFSDLVYVLWHATVELIYTPTPTTICSARPICPLWT